MSAIKLVYPKISIHALREEGDPEGLVYDMFDRKFQSTPSARRATIPDISAGASRRDFNPRPPRGGRLFEGIVNVFFDGDFNPRPPRGGRQSLLLCVRAKKTFQSTPSARRATQVFVAQLARGRDFNPRPPRGGRLAAASPFFASEIFQSTPSARRATSFCIHPSFRL